MNQLSFKVLPFPFKELRCQSESPYPQICFILCTWIFILSHYVAIENNQMVQFSILYSQWGSTYSNNWRHYQTKSIGYSCNLTLTSEVDIDKPVFHGMHVVECLYFTCAFLITRPFHGYQNFWPSDLDLEVWPTYKKITLAIVSLPEEIELSYIICTFPVTRPFHGYQKFWPCDLHVWPPLKKL